MLFQIEKYYNANKDSIYRSTVVSTIGLWIARQVTIRSTSRVNDSLWVPTTNHSTYTMLK